MLFCHVTSRVQGAKHDDLLGQKGGQGFPHLVAMDSEGEVLAELDGPRSVQGFEGMMAQAKEFVGLIKKAKAGDKEAKVKVLLHRLKMGSIPAEEAEKEAKAAGPLTKEQEETIQSFLANAAVKDVLKGVTREKPSRMAAGKKFLEMKKAGKPVPSGEMEVQAYWILMLEYAEDQKDAAVFEEALNALKKKFGDNPQAQQFFKGKEEALKKLKEGK